jgi:hypothetical protein
MKRRSHVTTILAANNAILEEGNLAALGDYFTGNYVAHGTRRGALRKSRFLLSKGPSRLATHCTRHSRECLSGVSSLRGAPRLA